MYGITTWTGASTVTHACSTALVSLWAGVDRIVYTTCADPDRATESYELILLLPATNVVENGVLFLGLGWEKSGSHDVVNLMLRIRVLSKSLRNCDRKPSSKPYRSKIKWVLVWSKRPSALKPSCNPIRYSLNHSIYKNTCNLDVYKVDMADSSWTRRGSTALTSCIRKEVETKAFYVILGNGKNIRKLQQSVSYYTDLKQILRGCVLFTKICLLLRMLQVLGIWIYLYRTVESF